MQEKIKVVYSWIGPRGPLWNTELPSVLSFASVAEGASTSSHMFWADDMWNRLFSKRKGTFEMYPAIAIEIDDNRPFMIPYTLSWRILFSNYFCGRTGILEFAHTPYHLWPLVRHNNGYILIDHSVEAFMQDDQLNSMHSYFGNIHSIPLNKIIYLTGCMNATELYRIYCEKYNIPDDPLQRLTIIAYPSSHQIFSSYIEQGLIDEPEYDTERVPDKLFLLWNRRFRKHRIELALHLENNDLVDRCHISFAWADPERPTTTLENAIDNTFIRDNIFNNMPPEHANIIINRFKNRLPLVLDGETNINQMCEDRDNLSRPYYQSSLVSIVTETNFDIPELTLTEKSFKPIKEKHPFIIVGVPGALAAMRDMGFKTFGEFWDESYDTTEFQKDRMTKISEVTRQIGSWSNEQIIDFRIKVKPILEYNYNHLKVPSAGVVVQKIVKHIEENFKS